MKIAYFVHGRGRGHSSRAIKLIEKIIASNHALKVYAGGDAINVLKPIVAVTSVNSTLPRSTWLPFFYRCYQDYKRLKKEKPDCVISDGDAPSVYAAKFLGIHVIAIGHSMIFPYANHPFEISSREIFKQNLTVWFATLITDYKFIVHFCKVDIKIKNAVLARPDLEVLEKEDHSATEISGDFLLTYFRDGNGKDLVQILVDKGFKVVNFGKPIDVQGVENHPLNNQVFSSMMKQAKGIVGSSGSNLISESIYLNKPLLLTYLPDDFEQSMNAKYAEYTKSGVNIPVGNNDLEKIQRFIDVMSGEKSKNNNFDGMLPLSDVVETYLNNKFK